MRVSATPIINEARRAGVSGDDFFLASKGVKNGDDAGALDESDNHTRRWHEPTTLAATSPADLALCY